MFRRIGKISLSLTKDIESQMLNLGLSNCVPNMLKEVSIVHTTYGGIVYVDTPYNRDADRFYILFLKNSVSVRRDFDDDLEGVVVGPFYSFEETKSCPEVLERLVTRRMMGVSEGGL